MIPVRDWGGQKSQPLSGRSSRASSTDDLEGHVPDSRRSSPLSAQQKPPKPPPLTPLRTRGRSRTRWDVGSCGDGGSHSWITQTGASSNADKRSRQDIAKSIPHIEDDLSPQIGTVPTADVSNLMRIERVKGSGWLRRERSRGKTSSSGDSSSRNSCRSSVSKRVSLQTRTVLVG